MLTKTITALNSFSVLRFSGAKTQDFLQGQLTCDMRLLSEHGSYSHAACCDHRGRMFANFWVVNWQQDFLFILPKSLCEILKNHLQKYAVFSKVKITIENDFFIAELQMFSRTLPHRLLTVPEKQLICILLPSENRYLIFAENSCALLHTFLKEPEITIHSDETLWQQNNIADQLAILCDKTSLLFTPQMINLEKLGALSFTKGCYVGQEIVARTQHLGILKRHLHRLTVKNRAHLFPGDPLKNENGDNIGVVVESISLDHETYDVLAVIEDRYTSFS